MGGTGTGIDGVAGGGSDGADGVEEGAVTGTDCRGTMIADSMMACAWTALLVDCIAS